MFVMITITYPPDKAVEVAKRFIKARQENPMPPFIKTVGEFVTSSLECGIKVCGIYEIEAGKEYEGLQELSRRTEQFFDIEGFRYQMEPVMAAEEAISTLPL